MFIVVHAQVFSHARGARKIVMICEPRGGVEVSKVSTRVPNQERQCRRRQGWRSRNRGGHGGSGTSYTPRSRGRCLLGWRPTVGSRGGWDGRGGWHERFNGRKGGTELSEGSGGFRAGERWRDAEGNLADLEMARLGLGVETEGGGHSVCQLVLNVLCPIHAHLLPLRLLLECSLPQGDRFGKAIDDLLGLLEGSPDLGHCRRAAAPAALTAAGTARPVVSRCLFACVRLPGGDMPGVPDRDHDVALLAVDVDGVVGARIPRFDGRLNCALEHGVVGKRDAGGGEEGATLRLRA